MAEGNINYGLLQKGVLTMVVNNFTSFKNCTKKRKQQAYVASRLNMLEENMRVARQYHEAIVGGGRLEADLKLEELFIVYEQIQEIYLEYRSDLLETLEKFTQAAASVTPGESTASSSKIRLREIDIPKFSGSYTTWRSFQGLFESMVHKNASLSDIDKMHYLKSCLVGEAERLLQHLPCDAGNYAKAWELLTSRYDHKRVLVNAQLKLLLGQSPLSKESANGLRVEHWDAILIYVLLHKLPNSTQQLWEEKLGSLKELPTYKQFTEFLETRFRTLEVVGQQDLKGSSRPWVRDDLAVSTRNRSYTDAQRVFLANTSSRDAFSCKLCHQGQHALRRCQRFLTFNPMERKQAVRNTKVCDNCLGYGHMVRECPSTKCCYFCQQRHHSLLHIHEMHPDNNNNHNHRNNNNNNMQPAITQCLQQPRSGNTQSYQVAVNPNAPAFQLSEEPQPSTSRQINTFHSLSQRSKVLLATAIVRVRSADGRFHDLRALIDPGSEATFITESAAQLLRLKRHRAFVEVSGLGMVSSGTTQNYVDITFASRHSTFESAVRAFVFKSLTGLLPTQQLKPDKWQHLSGLRLADPDFYLPAQVDLLFGSDVFAEILLPDIMRCEDTIAPIAQNTRLGWIIFGKVPAENPQRLRSFVQFTDLSSQLQTFWEMEEEPFQTRGPEEDIICDEHFARNTKRLSSGRYEVMLPFKEEGHPAMGSSKECALRRFAHLEKRFALHPKLHESYSACIREYITLQHMEEVDLVDDTSLKTPYHYFLPHHAVFKEASSTTKLRVVFDAAAKTSNGTSLNDRLLVGPKLQTNIVDLILRWRTHRVTFTADIEKMYRQILVSPPDRYYQLIFWRDNQTAPLKAYKLKTVTFGTASAPYLAIRILKRLAEDEKHNFPLGAQVVLEDMYVDDLISGADSVQDARQKRSEAQQLLASAGFYLRKWTSNERTLVDDIPEQDREIDFEIPFEALNHVKTLGIKWFPISDSFSFQNLQQDTKEITKRSMLSAIAKLFDPLGWISPCIITAKIMMQQLWSLGSDWDDPIPLQLKGQWEAFRRELPLIERIKIPRWINMTRNNKAVELHGFCDASMKAFGAAVYLRVLDSEDNIHVHLLISKTKVAPCKRTVSLPRLELCGAVVLATLLQHVAVVLGIQTIYAWTDSMITQAWIRSPASKWDTFVANRVSEIQRLTDINSWRHVPTLHNPADLTSRGVLPGDLESLDFWWQGPRFLRGRWEFEVPEQPLNIYTEEERRSVKTHCAQSSDSDCVSEVVHHFSQLSKVVRVIANCLRFAKNCRTTKNERNSQPLGPQELHAATLLAVKAAQKEMFLAELNEIQRTGETPKVLRTLNAFIDAHGVLRVGGRLQNSNLCYEEQHPTILKYNHHFTSLVVRDAHDRTFHGGIQQMIAYIRRTYWIGQIKRVVKYHIHRCKNCFRQKAKEMQQLMGSLPAARVRMARPFSHTGVDYAGPIEIKSWKGRGGKTYKGYFAVFICLATKAIHIEVVSDLTTQAFLAAFRRFTARRGVCTQVFSDCGTNFVGANAELRRLLRDAHHDWKEVAGTLANLGTEWHFIPPASPHFGGLWEAGVKSVKYHLKRVVGNERLTYEELATFLTQIEACLNSRPLCPLSDNADDLEVITPAHFLVGESLHTIPQGDNTMRKIGYLDRWKRLQAFLDTFWHKWNSEYLSRLQQRPKWIKTEAEPKIGDLVLLKDERLPPSHWSLARIQEMHPGSDGLTRVVTIKTKSGVLKRPIAKICYLPTNKSNEDNTLL